MHKEAEYGVASHVFYKAADDKNSSKKKLASWIKDLSDKSDTEIKNDFLSERIFVFTPKGDVVDLPTDSSTVDFAYAIHSDIGDHMSGAKVNGKLSSLDTLLKGGEIIEIITSKNARPNRKWLDYTKTALAKKQIKNFLHG
jgi:GTP pyrophosphokinase